MKMFDGACVETLFQPFPLQLWRSFALRVCASNEPRRDLAATGAGTGRQRTPVGAGALDTLVGVWGRPFLAGEFKDVGGATRTDSSGSIFFKSNGGFPHILIF